MAIHALRMCSAETAVTSSVRGTSHPPRDVDLLVACDQRLGARRPVDSQHDGLIAADRATQEPSVPGAIDMRWFGAEDVIGCNRHDLRARSSTRSAHCGELLTDDFAAVNR